MTKKDFQRRVSKLKGKWGFVCLNLRREFSEHGYDDKTNKICIAYKNIMGGKDDSYHGLFGKLNDDYNRKKREMSLYFFEQVVIEYKLYKEF
tara:strand:+ start:44 stop:319 length:276 start_codon:yes stop_codon:yes gene_type:complete